MMKKILLIGDNDELFVELSGELSDAYDLHIILLRMNHSNDYLDSLMQYDAILIANFTDENEIYDDLIDMNHMNNISTPIMLYCDDYAKCDSEKYFLKGVISIFTPADSIEEILNDLKSFSKIKKVLNKWKNLCSKTIKNKNKELQEMNKNLIDELLLRKNIEKKITEKNRLLSQNLKTVNSEVTAIDKLLGIEGVDVDKKEIHKLIIENTSDFVYITLDEKFVFANKALCNKLHYSADEIKIKKPISLIHPEDRTRIRRKLMLQAERHKEHEVTDVRIITKENEVIFVEFIAKRLNQFNQTVFFIVAHDITERKLYEQQLHSAKNEAEALSHAKMNFIAQISHELRTPLNAIIGFTDLLKMEEDDKRKLAKIEQISVSGQILLKIINDLIQLSSIENGRIKPEKTTFALDHILTSLTEIYSAKCMLKQLKFEMNIQTKIPQYVSSDTTIIFEIFDKLMSNALKFTKIGRITVNVRYHDQMLTFDIIDTGIGIEEEEMVGIFDTFNQVSDDYTRNFDGIGLGLSIAKKLVDLLDGHIEVESTMNEGSKFSFCFPVEEVSL